MMLDSSLMIDDEPRKKESKKKEKLSVWSWSSFRVDETASRPEFHSSPHHRWLHVVATNESTTTKEEPGHTFLLHLVLPSSFLLPFNIYFLFVISDDFLRRSAVPRLPWWWVKTCRQLSFLLKMSNGWLGTNERPASSQSSLSFVFDPELGCQVFGIDHF